MSKSLYTYIKDRKEVEFILDDKKGAQWNRLQLIKNQKHKNHVPNHEDYLWFMDKISALEHLSLRYSFNQDDVFRFLLFIDKPDAILEYAAENSISLQEAVRILVSS